MPRVTTGFKWSSKPCCCRLAVIGKGTPAYGTWSGLAARPGRSRARMGRAPDSAARLPPSAPPPAGARQLPRKLPSSPKLLSYVNQYCCCTIFNTQRQPSGARSALHALHSLMVLYPRSDAGWPLSFVHAKHQRCTVCGLTGGGGPVGR